MRKSIAHLPSLALLAPSRAWKHGHKCFGVPNKEQALTHIQNPCVILGLFLDYEGCWALCVLRAPAILGVALSNLEEKFLLVALNPKFGSLLGWCENVICSFME